MATILVVDDKPSNRQFLTMLLGYAGHSLLEAADGAEALETARKAQPDLVIADVLMPQMDGFEFVRRLRLDPLIAHTRVIFYTANFGDAEADALARGCGVMRMLIKPSEPEEILSAVAQALETKHSNGLPSLPEHFDREHMALVRAKLASKVNENEKLKDLCQLAERFVDDVSHEFRTPLTVIQGYCSAIVDGLAGEVGAQQKDFLQIVLDRTRDLTQMVDDLLDSSKLRAGSLRVDRKTRDIREIFAPVRGLLKAKAAANKVTLREDIDPDLTSVFADAEKASRVIVNLVVNAIKFSSAGSEVTMSARHGAPGEVLIEIADQGPGIALEDLEIIFQRFQQVGMAQRSSTKGFGLGLSIAKELVSLNLGSIGVHSAVGAGSTFWFSLPIMDWDSIFSRFFAQVIPDSATAGQLTLLKVVPSEHDTLDQARSLVISSTYARDLVFAGAEGAELFVTGFTGNPQEWVNRLQESCRSLARQTGTKGNVGVNLEIVNAWKYPAQIQAAKAALLALAEGVLQLA